MKLSIFKPRPPAPQPVANPDPASVTDLRIAAAQPERFVSRCACALHDEAFFVVYERNFGAGRFVIAGITKGHEGGDAGNASSLTIRGKEVAASEVDTTGWRCPHCSAGGLIVGCSACGMTICGGRTRTAPGAERVFECRPSCGARGTLHPAQTIRGAVGAPPQRGLLPPQRLSPSDANIPRLGKARER